MEENIENVNKNNKVNIILLFIGVFILFYIFSYCITQVVPQKYNTWLIINGKNKINYLYEAYRFFKLSIYFLMHYLPTFLILKYVFKKTKSLKKRMWSVAFLIPITNLLYSIIYLLVSNLPNFNATLWYKVWYTDWFFMETIGETLVYFDILLRCFLPSVVLTSLIIPKKYLPIKGKICKTALLTYAICMAPFVILLILLILYILISNFISTF